MLAFGVFQQPLITEQASQTVTQLFHYVIDDPWQQAVRPQIKAVFHQHRQVFPHHRVALVHHLINEGVDLRPQGAELMGNDLFRPQVFKDPRQAR